MKWNRWDISISRLQKANRNVQSVDEAEKGTVQKMYRKEPQERWQPTFPAEFLRVLCIRVSQAQHCWHLESNNSLFWGAALHIVGCQQHYSALQPQWSKASLDFAKGSQRAKLTWLRTTFLYYSFCKYLLNTSCVPSTVLGTGDIEVN